MADFWGASDNAALGAEIIMLPIDNFSGQRRYGKTELLLRSPMLTDVSRPAMPRSPVGKVLRRAAKELFA
jgi:hypothetical protein